ncbi:hypothetical protein COEREDRAFT_8321 [Coemansia reversa NRRL 1564]|uniref:BZIP domain-containing protein n=1 Tax=Coemansia reversa (strain ATCC 12441 / NRRL 1564) TaxID=763665 RepID=A0A2G5BC11_COERN|nr:hypothetical protein COEREDRAFT_8321 [Coemansia reversa NRRL 1564]|eukprot:PIA16532.1 hypothetical protein COEREDRAFT_8321 [Coemansia reversa NRRL 1564]
MSALTGTAEVTEALAAAAAEAASVAPSTMEGMTYAANNSAPFPKLQPEQDVSQHAAAVSAALSSAISETITAAAISTAMASTQIASGMSLETGTTASDEQNVLASLSGNAHDQVMEMMHTYQAANAHRRRSSVEAAAAASSVLASIANSSKPYMDGGVAAAMAAAVHSQTNMPPIATYAAQAAQHSAAAAALLAASNMPPMMLPTIPSGTTSLRNTPPPSATASSELHPPVLSTGPLDNVSAAAASLSPFAVSCLSSLPSSAPFAMSEQITASIAATAIGMAPGSLVSSHIMPTPTLAVAAADDLPRSDSAAKYPQTGRGRNPAAGISVAAAVAAAQDEERYSSDSENDDNPLSSNGMPLTPDAPGSGRPGSLRHLTTDERRARRLQRNRLAAKECRQKKKAYIQNLEEQVDAMQEENSRLRKENGRLRKENEELGAKLTLGGMRASSAATTPVLDPNHAMPSECNDSIDSLSSPSLASKRPRVAVRSTSSARLQNGC